MHRLYLLFFIILYSSVCFSELSINDVRVDENYLQEVVHKLSVEIGPRNFNQYKGLEAAARYIRNEFERLGYDVTRQVYKIDEVDEVENIIVMIGPEKAERLVIGAHYDTDGDQPGADDNASGVAGLLAVAALLKQHEAQLTKRVELVAFTLEEPPFFRSRDMGSYIHAKSLKDKDVDLLGMVSLEMIGYFKSEENTQEYPLGLMKIIYPGEGDFIGVVSNITSRGLKSEFSKYLSKAEVNVETLSAPSGLVGVDFSDHLNYWHFGYDAIMVTDTAFYRNPNYHKKTDTIDTLNFTMMREVVRGVFFAVYSLASQ